MNATVLGSYRTPAPGRAVVIPTPEYVGTTAHVSTPNGRYYTALVAPAARFFAPERAAGVSVHVWRDRDTGEWVADYWAANEAVEAGRARSLRAALSVAVLAASEIGHERGLW